MGLNVVLLKKKTHLNIWILLPNMLRFSIDNWTKSMITHTPNFKPAGMVTVLATTVLLPPQILWVGNSDRENWEYLHLLHKD